MSSKKDKIAREERDWDRIDEAVADSGLFLGKNMKPILTGIGIVVVIACLYLGYKYFVVAPKNIEALNAMSTGENYFKMGQDSLAFYGDSNGYIGFEAIIKEYGSTEAGNAAKFYAAVSAYNLGAYDKAKAYAEDFSANDLVLQYEAKAIVGDCLANEGKLKEAIPYFIKAAEGLDDVYYSPIMYKKAGLVYKELKDYDKVIEIFTLIKDKYTTTNVATNSPIIKEANKYIEEAQLLKK